MRDLPSASEIAAVLGGKSRSVRDVDDRRAPIEREDIPSRFTSASRPPFSVEVVAWKPLERGTLLGFAEIRIPQLRLRISDLTIHRHESGKRWVGLPGRPSIDRDGSLVRTESGKPEYTPVLRWEGRAVSDAFSARVIEALDAYLARVGAG